MKKHELLKYAYDNYPKGTKFTWKDDTIPLGTVSSGKFFLKFEEYHNCIFIYDKENPKEAVFNGDDWAEIIEAQKPKEIELDCGIVSKNGFAPKKNYTFFEKWEIQAIYKAMEELNG